MEDAAADPESRLNSIEGFLKEVIGGLAPEAATGRGRPRVLPGLALWAGMLVCVVRGFSAQLELWRLLTAQGLWDFPRFCLTDDAIYKRLKHASSDVLQTLFDHVTVILTLRTRPWTAQTRTLAAFAAGVYAVDQLSLDAIKKRLPSLREIPGTVLPGTLSAVFDVRAQLWRQIAFNSQAHQNEKVAARSMVSQLAKSSLILADLGYFAFAWFDELTRAGYFWVSRLRAKTSYTVIHTFYEHDTVLDALVWLGAYRSDQAEYAVRLVRFSFKGQTWSYLTNVLDPRVLSIREISLLYARRWDIEMMFNLVKTHLGLHVLWSSHLNVVVHQVLAVFTVAQIILGLRAEIAVRAQADVFEISLDLLVRWLPRFAQEGHDPVQRIVERGRQARIIRPSTRRQLHSPDPPIQLYTFLPDSTPLTRHPRYAHKS